jgi:A/G-specific adenine glycosylase
MLGWPGSDWTETAPSPAPPIAAQWTDPGEEARHTFTHFHLRLAIRVAHVPQDAAPMRGRFYPAATFRLSDLPTVMRKVFDLARTGLEQ